MREPRLVSVNVRSRSGNATFIVDTLAVTRKAPSAVDKKMSRVRLRSFFSLKGVSASAELGAATLNTWGRALCWKPGRVAVTLGRVRYRRVLGSPLHLEGPDADMHARTVLAVSLEACGNLLTTALSGSGQTAETTVSDFLNQKSLIETRLVEGLVTRKGFVKRKYRRHRRKDVKKATKL